MVRAREFLSECQRHRVDRALTGAHARGAARIVPVVVTSSSHYPRAEDLVGLVVGVGALGAFCAVFHKTAEGGLQSLWQDLGTVGVVSGLGAAVMGFVLGTLLAAHCTWLRRLLVTRRAGARAVQKRARTVYLESYMRYDQEDRPDILLLYVSLFERRAAVVAGQKLLATLSKAQIDSIRRPLEAGLARGRHCLGLVRAISRAARLLPKVCKEKPHRPKPLPLGVVTMD